MNQFETKIDEIINKHKTFRNEKSGILPLLYFILNENYRVRTLCPFSA